MSSSRALKKIEANHRSTANKFTFKLPVELWVAACVHIEATATIFSDLFHAEHEERRKAQDGRENEREKYRGRVMILCAKPYASVRMPKQKRPTLPKNHLWKYVCDDSVRWGEDDLLNRYVSPNGERHRKWYGDGVKHLREVHVEHQINRPRLTEIGLAWNVSNKFATKNCNFS